MDDTQGQAAQGATTTTEADPANPNVQTTGAEQTGEQQALKAAAAQQQADPPALPPHADLVTSLRQSASHYGPDFIGAIQAAAHEVSGLATRDAERLRQLLTQSKGADDAFQRCQEVIDNMQGPDGARREVIRLLGEQYA